MRRCERVERQRGVAHLRGERRADQPDHVVERDVLVVLARRRLRGRREQRLRQLLRQAQAGRQRDAADPAVALIVLPARADQVAAHHRLERQRLQAPHDDRASLEHLALVRVERQRVERPVGELVRHDVAGAREPEVRDLGQHPALVRDRVRQHHVERRQPVGGHDQHRRRIDLVDVAHLAGVDLPQVAQGRAVHGGGWILQGERTFRSAGGRGC